MAWQGVTVFFDISWYIPLFSSLDSMLCKGSFLSRELSA
jgi:hypothetical protein